MAYSDIEKFGIGSGLGNTIGGAYGLFNPQPNPASAAMPYLNQIPGATQQYYQPYFESGKNQLPGLSNQYSQLTNNPGQRLNEIGSTFHESPGFQFALQQALQGIGHKAASHGMLGSPQHEQQNMELATQLGNQDYYNYLGNATNLYGQGLQGSQNLAGLGQGVGGNLAEMIAQTLAAQSKAAYEGQAQKNQNEGNSLSSLLGGLGSLAFAFL